MLFRNDLGRFIELAIIVRGLGKDSISVKKFICFRMSNNTKLKGGSHEQS